MRALHGQLTICLLALTFSGCVTPRAPAFAMFADDRYYVVLEPIRYQLGDSRFTITVPAGFVTDLASVPRQLWTLYPPKERYFLPAIIHDYLYWTQSCTREQADKIFLLAMEEHRTPRTTRTIVYNAVRIGGESAWRRNQEHRRAGRPRIIPRHLLGFSASTSWSEYERALIARAVKVDEKPAVPAALCNWGY